MSAGAIAVRLLLSVPAAVGGLLLFHLLGALLRLRDPRVRAVLLLFLAVDAALAAVGLSSLGFLMVAVVVDPDRLAAVGAGAAPALVAGLLLPGPLLAAWRIRRSARIRADLCALARLVPAPGAVLREVREAARDARVEPPAVFLAPDGTGPFVAGGVLVLPGAAWEALPAPERRAALRHEIAHVARGDGRRCLAIEIASALFWFNPTFGALLGAFGRECEALADRAAVRFGADQRALARSLVTFGAGRDRRALVPGLGVETRRSAERRIRLLVRPPRRRAALVQVLLLALLLPASIPGRGSCRLTVVPMPAPSRGRVLLGFGLGPNPVLARLLPGAADAP